MASVMNRALMPARSTLSLFQKFSFFLSRMWEPILYSSRVKAPLVTHLETSFSQPSPVEAMSSRQGM